MNHPQENSTKALFTTQGTPESRRQMLNSSISEVEYNSDPIVRKLAGELSHIAFGIHRTIDSVEQLDELLEMTTYDKLLPNELHANKFHTSLIDYTRWWLEGKREELAMSRRPGM